MFENLKIGRDASFEEHLNKYNVIYLDITRFTSKADDFKNNPLKFQNDLTSLDVKDQVLTLLVHLGYLAYDGKSSEVYIPNQEVAEVFKAAVEETGWGK